MGLLLAVFVAAPIVAAHAAPTDPEIRSRLGLPDTDLPAWQPVFSRAEDTPSREPADAPEIRAVSALHLGGRRLLFRVQFDREPNFRTAIFILYMDVDNDPSTGRTDTPAHEGVDVMAVLGRNRGSLSFHHTSLMPENTRMRAALDGESAYLAIEGPFVEPGRDALLRLHGLSQVDGGRSSSFPRTVVRLPGTPGQPPPFLPHTEEELHPGDYRFRNENVRYEGAANRGLTRAEVEPADPIEFGRERPLPRFDRPSRNPEAHTDAGRRQVAIELLEEAGVARAASPVTTGIPFPQGTLFDLERIQILDVDGNPVPAQFSALAYWPDDSLRWVLADWTTPIAAGERLRFTIESGSAVPAALRPGAVEVREEADRLRIGTGRIEAILNRRRFGLFEAVRRLGGEAPVDLIEPAGGVRLVDEHGRVFTTAGLPPESFLVEEQGPEKVVIRVEGRYGSESGEPFMRYITRLTFRADSARITIAHTHVNDWVETEFIDFTSLEIPVVPAEAPAGYLTMAETGPGGTAPHSARRLSLFQADEHGGQLRADTEERPFTAAPGAFRAGTGPDAITLALHEFRERWPKGIAGEPDGIRIGLLPALPGPEYGTDLPYPLMFPFVEGRYRLKWGMSFTERVTLDFSGAASMEELAAEATWPLIAVLPAEWHAEAGAMEPVAFPSGRQFADWDAFARDSLEAHLRRKESAREYGFLNYGDWFGERGRNWGNNEYDTAHGLFMQFLRTGDRRFHRLALATARHQADVDIVHAYPDPFYVGANHQHSIGHTGEWSHRPAQAGWSYRYDGHTSAGNGHTWAEGMVSAWFLTGDARVMEAALSLGEHIVWAFTPGFDRLGTHERSAGWSLVAILALHRATGDPVYLDAAARIAAVALDAQRFDEGGIWPHVLPRDHAQGAVDAYGNNVFLISTLLSGLAAYHEATGDPAVLRSLRAACDWLQRSWIPSAGAWPYSATIDGEPLAGPGPALNALIVYPLAYLASITGDTAAMQIVEQALESTFVLGGSVSFGKDLSMRMVFTPRTLGLIQAWREARDPDGADRLLDGSEESLLAYLQDTPPASRHAVRAPDRKFFRARITDSPVVLLSERFRHGALPPRATHGEIRILDAGGAVIAADRFSTDDPHRFPVPLSGQPGDEFRVRIDDDQRGIWDLSGEGLDIRMETVPGFRIGRPGRARYTFSVPTGTDAFSVTILGVHEGIYGAALLSPDGSLRALHRGANHTGPLLPDREPANAEEARHRFTLYPELSETGRDWSLIVWASGDIGIELEGVPPLLW